MMKLKKLLLAAAIALALCFAVRAAAENGGIKPCASDCNRTYIFRDEGGYVACCEQGEDEPFLITNVRVTDLTPKDRQMLSQGVSVRGARAMSRALEDYTS